MHNHSSSSSNNSSQQELPPGRGPQLPRAIHHPSFRSYQTLPVPPEGHTGASSPRRPEDPQPLTLSPNHKNHISTLQTTNLRHLLSCSHQTSSICAIINYQRGPPSLIMAAEVPAALKAADITRFAHRASQLEKPKPILAYWCMFLGTSNLIIPSTDLSRRRILDRQPDPLQRSTQCRSRESSLYHHSHGQIRAVQGSTCRRICRGR